MKTNLGLVEFCKQAQGCGYVYGTFGDICTISLLDQCAVRYPDNNLAGGAMRTMGNKWLGKIVTDCIGLLKFYMFTDKYGDNPHGGYSKDYDTSANGAFNNAAEKGPISTIPEIPGICLHMNGHFGVYIGNGDVIEARGTYYGVVKTRLKDRPWTYWFKSPWIEYVSATTAVKIDTTIDVIKMPGEVYTFKTDSTQIPTVTLGSDGIVKLLHCRREMQSDYWHLFFIGNPGQAVGIYTAAPGEGPLKRFVARIK